MSKAIGVINILQMKKTPQANVKNYLMLIVNYINLLLMLMNLILKHYKICSNNILIVQERYMRMKPSFKPEFIVGGFAAHCTNQDEQEYDYEPNENGTIYVAHWSERKKGFYSNGLHVTPFRHEFYDYNF